MPLTRSVIDGTSHPGYVNAVASTPRRFSLHPTPRIMDDPMTATRGPVAPGPGDALWMGPALDPLGRAVDEAVCDRNDAGPLGVYMGGVSPAGEALVDLGQRRLVTVSNPSLLVAPDLNEAIFVVTDLSTSSLRQCSSLITSWLTRCPSASWEDWVWMSTWVLVAFLYFKSSFFRSSIC